MPVYWLSGHLSYIPLLTVLYQTNQHTLKEQGENTGATGGLHIP